MSDGRFEQVDSAHFIHAEQPGVIADRVRHLLERASRTAASELP